jgi:histidyl-tRNA synthetase
VAVDFSGRKLGDQLKIAQKKLIDDVLILGAQELNDGNYTLKNLASGTEQKLGFEDLIKKFKS